MEDKQTNVTQVLAETSSEPPAEVAKKLMPLVYDELRALAEEYLRSERRGHTLQPTALVHEAFMRLVDQSRVDWKGRTHFYAVGAEAMRRILIDHARARGRGKRGGEWQRVVLEDAEAAQDLHDIDLAALHDALETLATLSEQQARIVELRFFGGLTVEEVAHVLGVSKRKVEGDWTHAKAWLRSALDPESAA
ncbi:MAG: ECF-type sigma factor [Planctomycetota bacterium]